MYATFLDMFDVLYQQILSSHILSLNVCVIQILVNQNSGQMLRL